MADNDDDNREQRPQRQPGPEPGPAAAQIQLHEQSSVLICLLCKAGIRPGAGVARHYRREHAAKGAELRQVVEIATAATATTADTGGLVDPHTAEVPADGSAPITQLKVQAGFGCTACRFLTTSEKRVRQHWTDGTHGHGQQPGWRDVILQSFSSGRFARYWTVQVVEQGSDSDSTYNDDDDDDDDDNDDNKEWERELAEYEAVLATEEAERRRTIDGRTGADVESPWVRNVGWAVHLAGTNLAELRQAAGEVGVPAQKYTTRGGGGSGNGNGEEEGGQREQQQLVQLGQSFEREISRCGRRIKQVPIETLRWLVARDQRGPAPAPFEMKQEARTMERYKGYWKRYLYYCVRAYRLGRTEARKRQRVRFTDGQWAALEAIVKALYDNDNNGSSTSRGQQQQEEEKGVRDLDRSVFRFCIASLKQKVAVQTYTNPLLHFTAVLGISPVREGWKRPEDFTPLLAGLAWCSRLLLLEHLFEHIPIREEDEDRGESGDDKDDIETADLDAFMDGYRDWIADGSYSPLSTINRYMSLGKGFRTKEGGMARIMWEDGKRAVRYLGQRIEIQEFRRTAQGLITEAETALDRLLYGSGTTMLARVELGRISDSIMFEGNGRSFVTNSENSWLAPGYRTVAELTRAQLWSAQRSQYHQQRSQRWLASLQQLKGTLLLLTHIWGGQPGRGPEITAMRHHDTQKLMRSVFVYDGQVMLITDRDKAKAIRGYGRKIARFLPERVGKLLVAYISWLIPFETMLVVRTGAKKELSSSLSEWLWRDGRKGRWGTEELTRQLQAATGDYIGVELGTAAYRHVAIELGRMIQGLVVQQQQAELGMAGEGQGSDEEEVDELTGERRSRDRTELIWDLQATHSSAIARSHYAVNIQFPGQLQPQMIANYREISRLWHQYLSWEQQEQEQEQEQEEEKEKEDIRVQGRRGREGRYNAKLYELRLLRLGLKRPQRDDDNSCMITRGARPEAVSDNFTASLAPSKRRRLQPRLEEPEPAEPGINQRIQRGLEAVLGPGASWRTDEQQEAMQQIMGMRGSSVLIVVLPTGGGKSLLFMIPAVPAVQGGVNIVVVPFVALVDDLVSRARELGLDCVRWRSAEEEGRDSNIPVRAARLVVVSADQASSNEFTAYADGLRAKRVLRRIYIDECHTIIMDASYRARLGRLGGLHRYDCPVILLTATLPVELEGWFRQQMVARDAGIIRAATAKKNIRYSVIRAAAGPSSVAAQQQKRGRGGGVARTTAGRRPLPQYGGGRPRRKAIEDEVVRLVEERNRSGLLDKDKKGVIYCRSKKDSEQLARRIGCSYYHSGMEAQAREQALLSWARGESQSRWITATTGLGTGVDISGIVLVIHVEQPYGLVDYIQQTGRGGRRAGEVAESTIVLAAEERASSNNKAGVEGVEDEAGRANRLGIEAFIETSGCRRQILGRFMDGVATDDCASLGAVRCDRCEGVSDDNSVPFSGRERNRQAGHGQEHDIQQRHDQEQEVAGMPRRAGKQAEVSSEDSRPFSAREAGGEGETGGQPQSRNRLKEERKEQGHRRRALYRWLAEVEGDKRCSICYVRWKLGGSIEIQRSQYSHRLSECREVRKGEYIEWRKGLQFGTGTCCWRCGLGLEWCEKIIVVGGRQQEEEKEGEEEEEEEEGEELDCLGLERGWRRRRRQQWQRKEQEECRWSDKIWPVLLYIDRNRELRRIVEEEMGVVDKGEWKRWIGRPRVVLGEKMTNGLAAWEVIVRQI